MNFRDSVIWLAGLLEGEGCFLDNPEGRLRITVQMTDKDVIEQAKKIFGARGCYAKPDKRPNRKPSWETHVYGTKAVGWMMMLYPFMGSRRKEKISNLLSIWRAKPPGRRCHNPAHEKPPVSGPCPECRRRNRARLYARARYGRTARSGVLFGD